MGKLWSASSTSLAMACAGSCALPQGPNTTSEAAELGTAVHAFLKDALETSKGVALSRMGRKGYTACARVDVEAIRQLVGGATFFCEEADSWHPTEDRHEHWEGIIGAREYPDDGAVWGTSDLIILRDDDAVEVFDFKTGKSVGDAATNGQLRMLALMTMRRYHVNRVRLGILYVDLKTGSVSIDDAWLSMMDIDVFESEVQLAVQAINEAREAVARGEMPTVNPSVDNCRWCRAECPQRAA